MKALTIERYESIRSLHTQIIRSAVNAKYISVAAIVSIIMESPAPRFYISAREAQKRVSAYYQGKRYKGRVSDDMVEDLVENYERIRKEHPHYPQWRVWETLIAQPAKSYYLSPGVIRGIVFNHYHYREHKK